MVRNTETKNSFFTVQLLRRSLPEWLIYKKDVGVLLMLIPNKGLGEPINKNKQRSQPTSRMIYSKLHACGAELNRHQ